ncbi:MAG: heavy metal translocating P-type ATPase [Balneolaceae bacterium]
MKEQIYLVGGMHCSGCVNSVEKAMKSVQGVEAATVNLAAGTATIRYNEDQTGFKDLARAAERAGYSIEERRKEGSGRLQEKRDRDRKLLEGARRRMTRAWWVTGPVMVWMFLDMVVGIHLTGHFRMELAMTASALYVILFPGSETLKGAWRSMRSLSPNMDVLIAIGTVASVGTGFAALMHHAGWIDFPMHSFAGIAAMIMAFHLTGRYIETKSRGHASDAITKLLTLEAETARVRRNGEEVVVPARDLLPGDQVVVREGEKIPADGKITEGEGTVNESMVTGESMPVHKKASGQVIGGTVNVEGWLLVTVERVGEESFLNRVVQLVEEAQGTRVPIQETADRVTAIFVPVVLLLSLVTFLLWAMVPGLFLPVLEWAAPFVPWVQPEMGTISLAFYASLAVLVIACPCALGLATPTALMVGSGRGAESGILIRRGEAIQLLSEATHIVFDKTGTLTVGEPSVTDVHLTGVQSREDLFSRIFAVEQQSTHPLARAIYRYAELFSTKRHELEGYRTHTGLGVEGVAGGVRTVIGNRRLMEREGVKLDGEEVEMAESLESDGKSVVYVLLDGEVGALLALADQLKPEAKEVMQRLHSMGLQSSMLTGDNQRVAEAVAARVGVGHVMAEVLPDAKEAEIRKLKDKGAVVVMVGDGINDAPALARADVGLALGTGTDVAIESGSIVLVDGSLYAVERSLLLARATFRKIRQNLFWAYFYNVVMIPLAIIGLMHPVLAEAAMALSSVNVIANSRRLASIRLNPES